jgi:DNA-binding response OmpR family regulator
MSKILLLEDDRLLNETIQDVLEDEGFEVVGVFDPYSAADLCYEQKFDLYLFDVNLPYENGFEFLDKLRASGDHTPTIFITSREDKASLQKAFGLGCDDYMKKPIDMDELILRINAILKRGLKKTNMTVNGYTIDYEAKLIYKDGNIIDISPKAIEVLLTLISSKSYVVTTETLLSSLGSNSKMPSSGVIRVYITQLKKYFDSHIENIRGVGYRWID